MRAKRMQNDPFTLGDCIFLEWKNSDFFQGDGKNVHSAVQKMQKK